MIQKCQWLKIASTIPEMDGWKGYFFCEFEGAGTLGQEQPLKPMRALPDRFAFVLPIVWIFAGLLVHSATTPPAPPHGEFPTIQAASLDGVHMNLPADFSGHLNLVIISFAREQQQAVDSWIPAARKIESAHSQFHFYELPTMARENLLYRWWFDDSLRNNTTDKELRGRILTAYVNKRAFKKSLQIQDEKRVVAILVDQKGTVLWRADGAYANTDTPAILSVLAAHGN